MDIAYEWYTYLSLCMYKAQELQVMGNNSVVTEETTLLIIFRLAVVNANAQLLQVQVVYLHVEIVSLVIVKSFVTV